jgi:hypothetical protein
MLEAPCPYHETPVKHAMKDCNLMKRYLSGKNKPQDVTNADATKNVKHNKFAKEDDVVMMLFGGTPARPPRRKHKHILQEIYLTEPTMPSYLRWSEAAITYDRADHRDHIPQLGAYPLVVELLFGTKRVHKVLMDGGSSLNIVNMSTLDSMGIQRSKLRLLSTPCHGVVPGMEAVPLGQINILVTLGDDENFCKEMLTFEVVGFPRTYHAILRRPAYAKFMAVPNYTYLKLKMPGPEGVISAAPDSSTHTNVTPSVSTLQILSSAPTSSSRNLS